MKRSRPCSALVVLATLSAAWLAAAPAMASLVISELMSINKSTLADEDGDFRDWIEIYNAGDSATNLRDWSLTDNPNVLDKWKFPEIEHWRTGSMSD